MLPKNLAIATKQEVEACISEFLTKTLGCTIL